MRTASRLDKTVDTTQASKSIVHLCADETITMKELVTSIGGLSAILGNGTLQIQYGLSTNLSSDAPCTAIVIATGFLSTKFDRYDPVECVLSRFSKESLEDDMDSTLSLESPLLGDIEHE